jgi:MFS family permease
MLILFFSFREEVDKRSRPLDVIGALFLMGATLTILFAGQGGDLIWLLAPALALVAFFLWTEKRAADPILPLDLMARRVMVISNSMGVLTGAVLLCTLTFVPLFVQGVLGGTPLEVGTTITPMAIGWPLASTISGRLIPRFGFRWFIRSGLAVIALSTGAIMWWAKPGVDLNLIRILIGTLGVGLGLSMTAQLIAVQTSVEWKQRGVATASVSFFRSMGGMVVVGVMGGILAAALVSDPSVPLEVANKVLGPERDQVLEPEVVQAVSCALQNALGTIFTVIAALALAAFLVGLFFPYVPRTDPSEQSEEGSPQLLNGESHGR